MDYRVVDQPSEDSTTHAPKADRHEDDWGNEHAVVAVLARVCRGFMGPEGGHGAGANESTDNHVWRGSDFVTPRLDLSGNRSRRRTVILNSYGSHELRTQWNGDESQGGDSGATQHAVTCHFVHIESTGGERALKILASLED